MKIQTKTQYILPGEQVAAVPLGHFDVFEDESTLVNRLYYAVPTFEEGVFHCDFYYEENTFRKEANGDLTLVHSEYGTDDPPKPDLPSSG